MIADMVHKTALQMHLQGQQNKHTSSKCRHSARYLEPNCSGFDLMDATASSQNERHAMPSSCHDRLGGGGGGGCKRIQASLPSTASQYRSPARLSHSSIHQCWHAGTSFLTRSRCVQPVFMKHGINDADSASPPPTPPLYAVATMRPPYFYFCSTTLHFNSSSLNLRPK